MNPSNQNVTLGSLSPPTTPDTFRSTRDMHRMVELSLSATNRLCMGSETANPDGWAKPARWGYRLLRFSSLPLPTILMHALADILVTQRRYAYERSEDALP